MDFTGGGVTTTLVTVATSFFTISLLYQISTQRELWLLLFLGLGLAFAAISEVMRQRAAERGWSRDVRNVLLARLLQCLQLTVMFVATLLLYDLASFIAAVAVPPLQWYDYMNLLATAPLLAYLLVLRMAAIFGEGGVAT
jgi:hypothetical protein